MPAGKDQVLNNHILHWGREDSSTLLLPRQHPDTPAPSYLPILPSETLSQKKREADESVFGPQLFGSSLHLVIWDNTRATESHQSYGWEKGFALLAHCSKLGGMCACG